MFCANCSTEVKKGAKFCGSCGSTIEQAAKKPAISKQSLKKIIWIVAASALVAAAVFGVKALLPVGETSFAVTYDKPSVIWAGEIVHIAADVTASGDANSAWKVELISTSEATQTAIATTSFKGSKASFSKDIAVGAHRFSLMVRVFDDTDKKELLFQSEPQMLVVSSANVPFSCNLPKSFEAFGMIQGYATAMTEDGSLDGGYECNAEYVYPNLSLRISYNPAYTDAADPYASWKSQVIDGNSGPYEYLQTTVDGIEYFYDEYVPNAGEGTVVIVRAYFHGIDLDFWNNGTFEENLKYIQEAISNIPIATLT